MRWQDPLGALRLIMPLYVAFGFYLLTVAIGLLSFPIRNGYNKEKGHMPSYQEDKDWEDLVWFIFAWPLYLLAVIMFAPFVGIYFLFVYIGKLIARRSGK
jgi:hypothetical protein